MLGIKKIDVRLELKTQPPETFGIVLKQMAMKHGLLVEKLGVHTAGADKSLTMTLSGQTSRASAYLMEVKTRFAAYVKKIETGLDRPVLRA